MYDGKVVVQEVVARLAVVPQGEFRTNKACGTVSWDATHSCNVSDEKNGFKTVVVAVDLERLGDDGQDGGDDVLSPTFV